MTKGARLSALACGPPASAAALMASDLLDRRRSAPHLLSGFAARTTSVVAVVNALASSAVAGSSERSFAKEHGSWT